MYIFFFIQLFLTFFMLNLGIFIGLVYKLVPSNVKVLTRNHHLVCIWEQVLHAATLLLLNVSVHCSETLSQMQPWGPGMY